MTRTPVTSSNLASIGYDPATKALEVEFKNGGIYHYADVTPEKHAALMAADSIGSHLHQHIKGKHAHTKLDPPPADPIPLTT